MVWERESTLGILVIAPRGRKREAVVTAVEKTVKEILALLYLFLFLVIVPVVNEFLKKEKEKVEKINLGREVKVGVKVEPEVGN
jgi:hypothetical protein